MGGRTKFRRVIERKAGWRMDTEERKRAGGYEKAFGCSKGPL